MHISFRCGQHRRSQTPFCGLGAWTRATGTGRLVIDGEFVPQFFLVFQPQRYMEDAGPAGRSYLSEPGVNCTRKLERDYAVALAYDLQVRLRVSM